jgi:hypothetical protein
MKSTGPVTALNEPMPGTIQCQSCGWWIVENFMHPEKECHEMARRLLDCLSTNMNEPGGTRQASAFPAVS